MSPLEILRKFRKDPVGGERTVTGDHLGIGPRLHLFFKWIILLIFGERTIKDPSQDFIAKE